MHRKGQPSDDVWSAPESGTVCGATSGNNPARGGDPTGEIRGPSVKPADCGKNRDDPSQANEER